MNKCGICGRPKGIPTGEDCPQGIHKIECCFICDHASAPVY